ncbi:amino acid adenylation domain-containing protein [Xanthomonas bundabergensis]|uniref:amino acid adenylation domain-containing protein n=1 Tax=Xanthomonas bundabergensis TaxID=3160842 RepID=UPI003B221725
MEQAIAAIWQELLGLEQVGRQDNFFELGGHSLLVIGLIEQLRQRGLSADVRSVFMAPTLGALAEQLVLAAPALRRSAVPPNPITPATSAITPELLPLATLTQAEIDRIVDSVPGGVPNIQDIYPLAPLQEGILFHHLLESENGGDTYLLCTVVAFDGRERLDAFLDALQRVIDRHDILRSAVHWEELSKPVQVVQRRASLPVHELTLSAETPAQAQLLAHTDPRRMRLDLRQAPILAAYVARDPATGDWLLALLNHHIVCDHIAQDLILSEIQALLQGKQATLPAPMPYRDFIARTLAVSEAEHEAYFREQLGEVDEPTAPFGVLDVQADSGGEVEEARLRLDEALAQRIREAARQQGVTPAVLFHLAWAQVLAQCSGRDDVVFGTVLSGRLQETESTEQVVGMFINTLPIRLQLAGLGAAEAVQETYRRLGALLPHEQTPLALAQRCSGIQPPLPLFTTLLNYRHSHEVSEPDEVAAKVSAWEGVWVVDGFARTNYPLTVSVDDLGQGFGLAIWSAPGIESARVMGYMERAIAALVLALAEDPQCALQRLDVLSAEEREQVLFGFNATQADYPQDQPIHALFEAQAARHPDAVALECAEQRLSYAELNRRANRVAHRLIAQGVKPDDRVAICMERSIDMVVGLLGILKAGGAYVPLDPAYPAERLAYLLADIAPVAVLVQSALRDSIPAQDSLQGRILALEEIESQALTRDAPDPEVAGLTSRHLAYVIYTSGSTGRPKGVMVEHRSVVRLVVNDSYAPLGADDCVGHCANPAFDASTWEIWGALLNGARLLVVPQSVVLDPQALNHALVEGKATALWMTAGLFNEYVNILGLAFAGLKYLLVGGDVLDPRSVARVLNGALPPRHLLNGYGPTETTTFATTFQIESLPDATRSIPIGRPIANTQVYVLGQHGEPAPVGVAGEIHIAGPGVARGYLNLPELTAQRFLADPFAADPDARMYRTGDLGRWLPDGTLEYLGRNDLQVKIRGFRIELGEIEARLAACAGVHKAVVIAREDTSGDRRLLAYVVPQPGTELSAAALRVSLSLALPDYMVPSAFVTLEALPLTPNGKLDRQALPAPDQAAVASRAYEAPVGEVEQAIAAIWQDLLGLARVGRHDHFFELGGHSLLAVRLVTHLRVALGVDVALREVFAQPTLAMLARTVSSAAASSQGAILPVPRGEALPLSWAQQRLWFLDQLDHAASASYHILAALRLSGVLDRAALQASLDRIVARHESLRTTFVSGEGEPRQVIAAADSGFALTEHDLRALDSAAQQAALDELSVTAARAPFDLARGPLIRGYLLVLAEREHVLLVTQHHIISDGWSIGILVREVATLYAAFSQGEPDPLPPLPIQYADYAAWQRQWLQGEVLQTQLDFWRTHLAGAPALLELPTDRPRPAVQSYRGDRVPVRLGAELSAALRSLSQRHNVTLYMTLHAAWAMLLARLSGQDEIVVGSPVANRPRAEIESLIGFFVNTLALRVDLRADPSVAELLAQVRATTLEAYAHQDLPFEQVVEALQPERNLSYNPVFQAWLNLNNAPNGGELDLPGLTLDSIDTEQRTARVDLSLSLTDMPAGLTGSLVYSSDLFEHETVQRIAGHWSTLLEAMVADDAQTVSRLPLLSSAERTQVLHGFNATQAAYPQQALIHGLFEAQAARQPDAPAVEYDGQALSYAELNRRANRLAHRLIGLGVKPDDRVALCTERSVEMVVGLLGILKAGGAYVPLDPAYPAERLAYMLADSAPMAVVTQAALRTQLPMLATAAAPLLVLDDLAHDGAAPAHDPVVPGLSSRHLAYVIYTSGSTGQPKGVMVEHRSAVNFWQVMTQTTHRHCPANARVALNAAFSFDMSLKGLLQLLSGHCLVLIPQALRANAAALVAFLEQQRIDAVDSTPSQLEAWLAAGLLAPGGQRPRSVLLGGEAIGPNLWERLRASSVVGFHNMYGPTECTVDATIEDVAVSAGGPAIGKPIANARIYLLDGQGQPVPIGVAGEIHIGGVGVARGYLHRPELTAQRFLADPFAGEAEARMYRTGDLGRWRADGTLEYLGRNDFQVKVRGFRIELGEIEARLAACTGVREAVVLAREDVPGDQRLVAYLVAAEGAELSATALREALAQVLPEYMVPSAFVTLEALPLTPNGKLDRKALPAPGQAAVASRAYEAPVGEVEQAIAAIWQELLGLEQVGRQDNFFELGGHSLLVMQLVIRIRERLQVDVPLRVLFEQPVFSSLAEMVVNEQLKLFSTSDVAAVEDGLSDLSEEELLALLANGVDHER